VFSLPLQPLLVLQCHNLGYHDCGLVLETPPATKHEVVQLDYNRDYHDDRLFCEEDCDRWALMAVWVSGVQEISDR
jgi:hypothetical protein